MVDISAVGLGLMGAALARAMQSAGHDLIVWNRSPEKMAPFARDGVACAPDLTAAVAASPVLLVCLDKHETTRALLGAPEVAPSLAGRVVVQLTSGAPRDAEETAAWMQARGATYLDGAVLAGPTRIGTSGAQILLSGDQAAYDASARLLDCLGDGTVRYLGPNVRAASALDLAWLMGRFGAFLGAFQSALVCRSEGVDLNDYAQVIAGDPSLQRYIGVIRDGNYDEHTASLQVWADVLGHIQQQGVDAGVSTEIPDFIAGLFQRAIDAGYGRKDVMAVAKVLEP